MNTDDVWTDVWVYEYWSKPSYIQNGKEEKLKEHGIEEQLNVN